MRSPKACDPGAHRKSSCGEQRDDGSLAIPLLAIIDQGRKLVQTWRHVQVEFVKESTIGNLWIMATNVVDSNRIDAMPTKDFFISMLVRDIDLVDAIADLFDNCVDGARRM